MAKLPAPLASALEIRAWPAVAEALERAAQAKEPLTTEQNLATILAWALVPAGLDSRLPLAKDSMTLHEFKTTKDLVDEDDALPIFQHALPAMLKLSAGQKGDALLKVLERWLEHRRFSLGKNEEKNKEPLANATMAIAQALVTSLPRKEAQAALGALIEPQVPTILNALLLDRLTDSAFLDVLAQHRVALAAPALLARQHMWVSENLEFHQAEQEDPTQVQARVVDRLLAHPAHLQLVRTDLNPVSFLSQTMDKGFGKTNECALILGQGLLPIYEGRSSTYASRLKAFLMGPAFESAISTGRLDALQAFLEQHPTFVPEGGWEKKLKDVAERLTRGAQAIIGADSLKAPQRQARLESIAQVLEFVLIHWTEEPETASALASDLNLTWKRGLGQTPLIQGIAQRIPTMSHEEREDARERLQSLDANPVLEVMRNVAGDRYRFSAGEVLALLESAPAPRPVRRAGPR